jgi:hypothetical protein
MQSQADQSHAVAFTHANVLTELSEREGLSGYVNCYHRAGRRCRQVIVGCDAWVLGHSVAIYGWTDGVKNELVRKLQVTASRAKARQRFTRP